MRRSRLFAVAAAVVGVAGFTAAATAGDQKRDFETDLIGYEEVPAVSTTGGGQVDAEVNRAGTELRYELRYRNLESAVRSAHPLRRSRTSTAASSSSSARNLGNGAAGRHAALPAAAGDGRAAR